MLPTCLFRYFLHSDLQSRYFWFRHCNMGLLLVLVSTHISMQALPSSTDRERSSTDLSRSCVQTGVVVVYLVAIIACRPYVSSRARFWKWYVSTFNKITTLLIVVARLVAEQARGYDAAHSLDSRSEARNILRAGLVLMVVSCVACAGQFLVLVVMFVWSLTEAAKKEQVEIVRKQRAREVALARLRELRRKLQRVSKQECPTNELERIHDELSFQYCFGRTKCTDTELLRFLHRREHIRGAA